ncbi:MAG TPA: hypothetical protein PK413_19985, partial [Thermoanaerobaculia bacterium]|nr:hypothetical protein [Thermoanaerobaculia bacterium]
AFAVEHHGVGVAAFGFKVGELVFGLGALSLVVLALGARHPNLMKGVALASLLGLAVLGEHSGEAAH